MELGQLLACAGGGRFTEERDGGGEGCQFGGAGRAVGEVLLEGGEVAARGMGSGPRSRTKSQSCS